MYVLFINYYFMNISIPEEHYEVQVLRERESFHLRTPMKKNIFDQIIYFNWSGLCFFV
jgi:hypothetical protein